MLGLRRWHINLLISEVLATAVVLWAYHDIATAPPRFLAGIIGELLLLPSIVLLWIATPPVPLPVACLTAAVVYTAIFFFVITATCRIVDHARWFAMRPVRPSQLDQHELDRYLR